MMIYSLVRLRGPAVAVSLLVACLSTGDARAQSCTATFTSLEVLGPFNESFAYGVSPEGSIAVGSNRLTGAACQGNCQAWLWLVSGDGVAISPPGVEANAYAASAYGEVVVGTMVSGGTIFKWTEAAGMQPLPLLPGGQSGEALDISADGTRIVGRSNSPSGEQALLIDDGQAIAIGTLPGGVASAAHAISLDGQTIVGYSRSGSGLSTWRPFRWSEPAGMQPLGSLPVGISYAVADAVSSDGSVVAGTLEASKGFFRWTSTTGIVKLPVHSGAVTGVSGDGGTVIGNGRLVPNGEEGPIIWDVEDGARMLRGVMVDNWGIDLTGWTLTSVEDISADGRTLVGFGWDPAGRRRAWTLKREGLGFADLNGDCTVDGVDLCRVMGAWGQIGGVEDLSGDGAVGGEDIALVLGAWTL